jgi:hypothetical protein
MKLFLPITCGIVAVGLSFHPARQLIERSMFWHMAIQMPLLLLTGWLLAQRYSGALKNGMIHRLNYEGLTAMLIASFILAYWMIPLTIDQAVISYTVDAFKIASLIFCGFILQNFFAASNRMVQLFFLGYSLAMLGGLGVYFITTDLRLCNAYSLQSQILTGKAICIISGIIGVVWFWKTTSMDAIKKSF